MTNCEIESNAGKKVFLLFSYPYLTLTAEEVQRPNQPQTSETEKKELCNGCVYANLSWPLKPQKARSRKNKKIQHRTEPLHKKGLERSKMIFFCDWAFSPFVFRLLYLTVPSGNVKWESPLQNERSLLAIPASRKKDRRRRVSITKTNVYRGAESTG